ncbi:MAG: PAS domain S-box protein [Gallionella sp.]|nr:PAS domain S-box protein [Gallionella sp.]
MKPPEYWDSKDFWLALAKGAGLFGAFIGLLVLFGWLRDIQELKSVAPHWVAMKANTALGFVLSGLALWLKADDTVRLGASWSVLRKTLAGTVFLIGALSLLEYLFAVDLGIDQWLFHEPAGAIGTLAPGRMAPASALGFMLLGSALLMSGKTARSRLRISMLAVLTALPALASVLIYLYDTDNAYGLGYFLQLAVHTALAFFVLALGLLCSQPDEGMVGLLRRHDGGGALARRLLPVSLFLPILIGWLKLQGDRSGLYEPDFGVALVALTYIVMLGTLVMWGARFLARIEVEREWMHASVAVSEARLRTLVSTIPDLIWLKDPEGVYLACNPAFERFFGAKEADIIGKTDYDFVPRELADFFRAKDQAAIAVGGPSSNEEWLTLADTGRRILAETTKAPMFGSQGELLGVLGIARDVTQRHESEAVIRSAQMDAERLLVEANQSRQALLSALEDSQAATLALQQSEESLRHSQVRYMSLFGAIADAVYVNEIQPDGMPSRFMEVNEVACRMTGYTRDELQGMSLLQLDAPDSGVDLGPILERLQAGESVTFEQVHLGRDGRRIPVEIHAHWFMLGEHPAVISLAHDISERKRAEYSLRESNALLHAFIEHSPIYAFIKNVTPDESRTVMASENFRDMIGIPGSEMAGKTMVELFPPDFAAKISADDWAVASGGEVLHLDEELNGRSYTTVKFPIHVGGKNYLAGYTIDITERQQLMDELEKHRAQLEQRVMERTRELQAVNKELEAFSYSVSHDLRAPLRAVAGFVELLKKHNYEAIDDKGRHYMDVIAEAAIQMGRLIDDILTFSRIGRAEMSVSRVDMNQLLAEVRNTLRPQSEGRHVEWKIAPLPEVTGERTMLSLVLQNLLSNALKFTQTRDVAVIEIGTVAGGRGEAVCYVRDNGVGFDMRHVDKLFGLFQRLHPQEQFEGTGVGLANVQRIVQRHGGRVWAEGKVNEGATFYFALPEFGGLK